MKDNDWLFPLSMLCRLWDKPIDLVNRRLLIGWTLKEALETPENVKYHEKRI